MGEDEDLKSGTEVVANFRSESESGVKALEVDRSVCVCMVELSKLKIFHDMTTNATFSIFFAHPKKRGGICTLVRTPFSSPVQCITKIFTYKMFSNIFKSYFTTISY